MFKINLNFKNMENKKQSLYTKYRPIDFDQVIGQKTAKKILINSIEKNKINHAYLFYGIRGTGKTTLARIFAKAINCKNLINNNPCNKCDICKSINNGSAFDVIEIDAASNNGVDEIRFIKENTTLLTTEANYKVYIIDEVHMLTKAAFNALLKTLEEPPRNTIFLLATTELNKIPQTVLSRTIIINLEVMSEKDINQGLRWILDSEQIKYEKESLEYIVMDSGGSLRDAISSLETTLLYNENLSVENTINSLGLVRKELISDLLNNNVKSLIELIDDNNKDPRKIAFIISEEMFKLIKNGEYKWVPYINEIIYSTNSIKDPILLKLSLKSIFFKYLSSLELENDKTFSNVSRETKKKNIEIKNTNNNIKKEEHIEKNNIKNNKLIEDNNEIKINKNVLNVITDFVSVHNYIFIIKNNNKEELAKFISRWKYKDSYIISPEFTEVIGSLINTIPLAASKKSIILGFKDESLIPKFKRISLTPLFFEFIKKFYGDYRFILPVNEDKWSKLISLKDKIEDNPNHKDVQLEFDDFLKKEKNKEDNIKDIFGEENVTYE
ncbi:MAG: hypothetical protein TYPL_0100 [Candidatus Tyloplasma litorale]|nr:MAG: hypothetical protein TYPL_0100 [Mycoplasmatales bacterium]